MRLTFAMLSAIVLVAAGCYPDAQWQPPDEKGSIRLPLSDLGINSDSQTLQRWLTWAGDGFDGEAFDMGVNGNDFAMDLRLYDEDLESYQSFLGESVSIDRSDGTDTLLLDVKISACDRCIFFVSLFWKEDPDGSMVSVFDGQSGEFSAKSSADLVNVPEFTITQTGTGTVSCTKGENNIPAGAWVAVRDDSANVRFPHVQLDSLAQPAAVLAGVPTFHTMVVEMDPLADGRFYSSIEEVTLNNDGEDVEVVLP